MIEIYNEMLNSIADEIGKDYIDTYREELLNFVGTESFNYSLKKLIYNNQYDCASLLNLFYPIYKKYWNSFSEKEVLKYIFDWILNLSFPRKENRRFDEKLEPLILFYLNLLRKLSKYELEYSEDNPNNMFNLQFLTEEEEKTSNYLDEYLKFKQVFIDNWIYELMKLDLVLTGHNTLEHVMGVNNLSLYIGRQLKEFNLPVDLGIVVGAALGHDIGKYGVRKEDIHRVPYLHYYYTEEWFNRFGLHKIGHIATNHSTWDLELEN
ncbi:MAG: HD domain-containing protein, partial [Tissierellales bacterium]